MESDSASQSVPDENSPNDENIENNTQNDPKQQATTGKHAVKVKGGRQTVWERNYEYAKIYSQKRDVLCEKAEQERKQKANRKFAQPMPVCTTPEKECHWPKITLPHTPEVLKHDLKNRSKHGNGSGKT